MTIPDGLTNSLNLRHPRQKEDDSQKQNHPDEEFSHGDDYTETNRNNDAGLLDQVDPIWTWLPSATSKDHRGEIQHLHHCSDQCCYVGQCGCIEHLIYATLLVFPSDQTSFCQQAFGSGGSVEFDGQGCQGEHRPPSKDNQTQACQSSGLDKQADKDQDPAQGRANIHCRNQSCSNS